MRRAGIGGYLIVGVIGLCLAVGCSDLEETGVTKKTAGSTAVASPSSSTAGTVVSSQIEKTVSYVLENGIYYALITIKNTLTKKIHVSFSVTFEGQESTFLTKLHEHDLLPGETKEFKDPMGIATYSFDIDATLLE